jgi:transposase
MARQTIAVTLTTSDRQELEHWVHAHRTPQQVVQRCRILLAAAKGQRDKDIAESMEINVKTVALWRQRFSREGPDALWEVAAGRGRKPQLTRPWLKNRASARQRSTGSG